MANIGLNRLMRLRQKKTFRWVGVALFAVLLTVIGLLVDAKPKKKVALDKHNDLTGIIDESFTDANAASSMTAQQNELESLKAQLSSLTQSLREMKEAHEKEAQDTARSLKEATAKPSESQSESTLQRQFTQNSTASMGANQSGVWHNGVPLENTMMRRIAPPRIHTVRFSKPKAKKRKNIFHPDRYVPSNTSVRAVILGGADADASVNGQSKNNGVMLFKFLEDGTLPNGQHSRLKGCRVSGNAYGDISSERAIATLYKISCAHPGEQIIDKRVNGWVFFNGKVGVKGVPLMRDNKIMQWAGVSGALSGIAEAAQYAQSVQSISSFGAASVVPQQHIGPFAAYGGASKAADVLSQYYVKRAEQYHPVIQVGSGNVVTIVFKDGFMLEPSVSSSSDDFSEQRHARPLKTINDAPDEMSASDSPNFTVPPEVLSQIDRTANQSFESAGVQP